MNQIIKLHGCSGAGKTTVARALITGAKAVTTVTPEGAKKPEAYILEYPEYEVPICVLGSYANNCGGMDGVSSAAEAIRMVKDYQEMGHVFHEGLLQSTYYGAMGKDAEQYGDRYVYAFLNTPLLICLARVTHRRDVMQSKNKFNPQLTTDKFNTIQRLQKKLVQNGQRVVTFDYEADPLGQIHTILRNAA